MNTFAIISHLQAIADHIGCSDITESCDRDGIILWFIIGESRFGKNADGNEVRVPITVKRKISYSTAKSYILAFKPETK